MTEVMLDIETLGTRPGSVILTIGAIKFDRSKYLPDIKDSNIFYRRIDIGDSLKKGMTQDEATVLWWKQQNKNARYEAIDCPDRTKLKKSLREFTEWFHPSKIIWGNGDDFDCVLLEEAYRICGMHVPWKFWNTRDCRTLFDVAGIGKNDLPQNNSHHAIHDCHRQIFGVKKSIDLLRTKMVK